jgi:hypothetical protein
LFFTVADPIIRTPQEYRSIACYVAYSSICYSDEQAGVSTEEHTCSKLEIPYPIYDEESNGWTSDHFSTPNASDSGSK